MDLALGITGIAVSLLGIGVGLLPMVSPGFVMPWAVRHSSLWTVAPSLNDEVRVYRHRILFWYHIDIDFSHPVVREFYCPFMDSLYRPDRSANSYFVNLLVSNTLIRQELFLSYDGSRNFIPVPVQKIDGRVIRNSYNQFQKNLHRIVGVEYLPSLDPMSRIEAHTHFYELPRRTDEELRVWGEDLDARIHALRSSI